MKVIWIDPGETVGWVTAEVHDGAGLHPSRRPSVPELEVVNYGNTKLKTFALALLDGAAKYGLIGFETYRVRVDPVGIKANANSTVPTLQLVGAIRLAAWNAQRQRRDGFPRIDEREPNQKSGGLGALAALAPPEIQDVVREALDGAHDDGHYGDAILHLYGWYHSRYHKETP